MGDRIFELRGAPWGDETMNYNDDAEVSPSEFFEGYLSTLRQDERGERHAYRKIRDDAYEVRPEKVAVKAKFRTKRYSPEEPDAPRGRRDE